MSYDLDPTTRDNLARLYSVLGTLLAVLTVAVLLIAPALTIWAWKMALS